MSHLSERSEETKRGTNGSNAVQVNSVLPTATPPSLSKSEAIAAILSQDSKQPIEFFGKVVDQFGAPVVGARIQGNVEQVKEWMGQEWIVNTTISDAEGNFEFFGLHGQKLSITPRKDGYEYKSLNSTFRYSGLTSPSERHMPKREAPVVCRMWKNQGAAEPLKVGMIFFEVKADGRRYTVDLVKGTHDEGQIGNGDLAISVQQSTPIVAGQHFDWSFSIESLDGGVLEALDVQYPYLAPADGYRTSLDVMSNAGDRGWNNTVERVLFAKLRNGDRFARIELTVHAQYQGGGTVSIRYFVNPMSGSRNLLFDPLKQL